MTKKEYREWVKYAVAFLESLVTQRENVKIRIKYVYDAFTTTDTSSIGEYLSELIAQDKESLREINKNIREKKAEFNSMIDKLEMGD